jgi:rhomboid protease GluP
VLQSAKIDFERGMSAAPAITLSLTVINAVIFFITVLNGALQSEQAIIAAGALAREPVLQGQIWRLVTAMFLHGSIEHLFGNVVGLFIVGMAAEHAYGKFGMMGIYFLSGLLGSAFSIMTKPGPGVGASGAIFGLLGAMIIFFVRYRDYFHLRDKRVGNVLLGWAVYSIVTAQFIPFIDNAAHIGGLIGGALAGYWVTPRIIAESKQYDPGRVSVPAASGRNGARASR